MTTSKELQELVDTINNLTGQSFHIYRATGTLRVVQLVENGGYRELTPNLKAKELKMWMEGYILGYTNKHK